MNSHRLFLIYHVLQSIQLLIPWVEDLLWFESCYFFSALDCLFPSSAGMYLSWKYTLQLIYQLLCETVIDQPSTSFPNSRRINNFLFTLLCLCYDTCHIFVLWLFINMSISSHKFEFFKGHMICFCICNSYHMA